MTIINTRARIKRVGYLFFFYYFHPFNGRFLLTNHCCCSRDRPENPFIVVIDDVRNRPEPKRVAGVALLHRRRRHRRPELLLLPSPCSRALHETDLGRDRRVHARVLWFANSHLNRVGGYPDSCRWDNDKKCRRFNVSRVLENVD